MTPLVVWLILVPVGDVSDPVALRDLGSPDPAARRRAVERVETRLADAGYLPALVALYHHDPALRELAARALCRHVDACRGPVVPGVVLILGHHCHDADKELGRACRLALSRLGELALPEIRQTLCPTKGEPALPADRLAAVEACRSVGWNRTNRQAVEALLWEAARDRDADVAERIGLALRFVPFPGDPPFRDAVRLRAALASPNPVVRRLAIERLFLLGEEGFAGVVVLLDLPGEEGHADAATLLGRLLAFGLEPTAEVTCRIAQRLDRLPPGQGRSVRDLFRPIEQGYLPAPEAVVAEVDQWIGDLARGRADAGQAAEALRGHGGRAVRALEDRLLARGPDARHAADLLEALLTEVRPSMRTLEALGVALAAPREEVAVQAARTLNHTLRCRAWGHLRVRVSPRVLDALAAGARAGNNAVRRTCADALAVCGRQAEGHLCDLLRDRDARVQYRAAWAVAVMVEENHGVPVGALPHLAALRTSPDPEVRDAAEKAAALVSNQPREKGP